MPWKKIARDKKPLGRNLIFMPPLFLILNYLPHLLSLFYPFIFLFATCTVGITRRKIVSIGLLKKLLGVNDIDDGNYYELTRGGMVLFQNGRVLKK